MDDVQFIERLKQRDEKAFEEVFNSLFHHVRFYAEQILNDSAEAEDIAIHSFARFWESVHKFNSVNHIRNFLYMVARNSSMNHLKRAKVNRRFVQTYMYLTQEAEDNTIERSLYEAAMLEQLLLQIENLPPQCREIFKLCFLENLPRDQVAERMNISVSTVHTQCHTAIKKLRLTFGGEKIFIFLALLQHISKN